MHSVPSAQLNAKDFLGNLVLKLHSTKMGRIYISLQKEAKYDYLPEIGYVFRYFKLFYLMMMNDQTLWVFAYSNRSKKFKTFLHRKNRFSEM